MQVLEICREVREHHRDILNGYFTAQDDAFEKLGFESLNKETKMLAFVVVIT